VDNLKKLVRIVARLRGPVGCPWDKQQDHNSLKPYMLEEAYEVLEAIDDNSDDRLSEELGDLLLQIILHAQIASERSAFDIEKIAGEIAEKLIERHPHVFDQKKDIDAERVLQNWEHIKQKKAKNDDYSVLQGVPVALPALLKAFRVQEKVGRFGFDWDNPDDVIEKIKEEIEEFRKALEDNDRDRTEEEFGDLLFSLVNLGRHHRLQAESALNLTTAKFIRRFQYIEKQLRAMNKTLEQSDLQEMENLWQQAKSKLR
jgi:tetrapyrrole methylase family protein/MazG family protein